MKKLLALVAASLLSLSSFAENTFHVGAFFPVTILDIDGESVVSETAGAAFDFTHVADCGFTFKAGAGCGFGLSDIEDTKGDSLTWFDLDFSAGFGGSFIHDEKMTLSLLGDIGLRIQGGGEESSDDRTGRNSVDYIPVCSILVRKFHSPTASHRMSGFSQISEFSMRLAQHQSN